MNTAFIGPRLQTFRFRKIHVPSGKSFNEECEFASHEEFMKALGDWNKIAEGFWRYEAIQSPLPC